MEREKGLFGSRKEKKWLWVASRSEHKENCCLIRTTEPCQGDSSGWSPSLASRCFRKDWTGNGVAGGLCESQAASSARLEWEADPARNGSGQEENGKKIMTAPS